jgi:hypothetical protein
MVGSPDDGRRPRHMAARWWKFAALVVALGFTLGLTACSDTPANDFEAGECTDDNLTGDIGEVETVDCDEEHTAESIGQFDLEGDDFPDDVAQQATEGCEGDLFEDYVGTSYNESAFLVNTITPTAETWDNGDRTVICVITGRVDDEPLEGSAEGSEE